MSFTLADLRYLLRLVRVYGAYEERTLAQSIRVEGKLAEMIGRARRKDRIVDADMSTSYPMDTQTVAHYSGSISEPWTLTIYRSKGGETMGKTSKSAPKKPKGKIGKAVKKK